MARARSFLTPCILQVTLYTPISAGIKRATRACSDKNPAHRASRGKKIKAKDLALLIWLRRISPIRFIKPGFGNANRYRQDAENEKHGIFHISLEISLIGRIAKKIDQDPHHNVSSAQRQGFSAP